MTSKFVHGIKIIDGSASQSFIREKLDSLAFHTGIESSE